MKSSALSGGSVLYFSTALSCVTQESPNTDMIGFHSIVR